VRLADLKPAIPLSDGEHCLSVAAAQNSSPGTPAYQISLFVTPDDLPASQQSQVTRLLTQALTTRQDTTVPAGSYYATSFQPITNVTGQRVSIASVPLQGSATIAPFALQDPQIGVPCVGFICPGSFLSGDAYTFTVPEWAVTVTLALRWRFTTASGKVVSDVLFQGDNPYTEVVTFAILFLALDTAGDWTIAQNLAMPSAASQLQDSFCGIGDSILQGAASPGQNGSVTTLRDLGAEGCEWLEQVNGIDQGIFLWRFGVLLAADARTHAAYPQLPLAPPAEIAAVAQA
jgi:hypothetical protein